MSAEPVLPEPQRLHGSFRDWYTADQMRAMFKAGREQGLEEVRDAEIAAVTRWVNLFSSGDHWKVEDEIRAILTAANLGEG